MTQSFAQAQAAVAELVERFRRNLDLYQRRVAIDRLVYELYGLTEEEIAVVEGACQ